MIARNFNMYHKSIENVLNYGTSDFYHMIYTRMQYVYSIQENITKRTFQEIWAYLYRKFNVDILERFGEYAKFFDLFSPEKITVLRRKIKNKPNKTKNQEDVVLNYQRQRNFVTSLIQKQRSRGVLRKRCSENIQQLYGRTPMPKCDFNKVSWNRVSD